MLAVPPRQELRLRPLETSRLLLTPIHTSDALLPQRLCGEPLTPAEKSICHELPSQCSGYGTDAPSAHAEVALEAQMAVTPVSPLSR